MTREAYIILLVVISSRPIFCADFDNHSVRGRKARPFATGRIEGERHLELTGKSRVQTMRHYGDRWSGNAHLLWGGVVGDSLSSSFGIKEL